MCFINSLAQATQLLLHLAIRPVVDSSLVLIPRLGDAAWQAAGATLLPLLDGLTSSVATGHASPGAKLRDIYIALDRVR